MEPTKSSLIEHEIGHQADVPARRITRAFEQAKQEGRGALIPYFMCGYPSAEQSVKLALAATQGGADIIELGIPFSDPLADGATIQHAGQIALKQGTNVKGCLAVARQIAAKSNVPLLLMGYYNPILRYGIEHFCEQARANGICGLIIPDLPPEEVAPLMESAQRNGLAIIFLIPPTTPGQRIAQIVALAAQNAGGFIYCVSLSGVTGARKTVPAHLRSFIAKVRSYTQEKQIPLAVGFGLSTPEHIAEVTSYADGAIIASALINMIDQYPEEQQEQVIRDYIQRLVQK